MSKFIFILLLLLSSINLFSQKRVFKYKTSKLEIFYLTIKDNKEETKVLNDTEINLLLNNNLCEILSIKPSDLLNEKMLKKLRANV